MASAKKKSKSQFKRSLSALPQRGIYCPPTTSLTHPLRVMQTDQSQQYLVVQSLSGSQEKPQKKP